MVLHKVSCVSIIITRGYLHFLREKQCNCKLCQFMYISAIFLIILFWMLSFIIRFSWLHRFSWPVQSSHYIDSCDDLHSPCSRDFHNLCHSLPWLIESLIRCGQYLYSIANRHGQLMSLLRTPDKCFRCGRTIPITHMIAFNSVLFTSHRLGAKGSYLPL